jgi:hypothetical protein
VEATIQGQAPRTPLHATFVCGTKSAAGSCERGLLSISNLIFGPILNRETVLVKRHASFLGHAFHHEAAPESAAILLTPLGIRVKQVGEAIRMKLLVRFTALLVLGLLLLPVSGYSYIDPGTGSYIIQLLIAAFVGISLSIRIFWKKIKTLLPKKEKADKPADAK